MRTGKSLHQEWWGGAYSHRLFLRWAQEITELPDYNKISFKEQAPVPLEEVLPDASPQALDLLGQFLLYPPHKRIAASQVSLKVVVTVLILCPQELWDPAQLGTLRVCDGLEPQSSQWGVLQESSQ